MRSSSGFPLANAGGISNGGTLTITNSTISDNSAGITAGGISNGGTLTITDSTVSGNWAGSESRRIWPGRRDLQRRGSEIRNSTASGNTAMVTKGSGIGGGVVSGGTETLTVIGQHSQRQFANQDGGGILTTDR